MKSDERIFRHSLGKLTLMSLGVLVLGYTVYIIGTADYFLIALAGIAFVIVLLYATSSVAISSEGITTKRLFGSKSLRWPEIGRVSMRGQALRLHNHDEDMILSIDSQLEDYKEIIDIIFSKRPDLLDESNNTVISASWLSHFLILGFGLFIVVGSVWLFSVFVESRRMYALLFLGLGLFIIGSWFLSPKRIALEDKTLLLIYLFRQVSYAAKEISSISLEKTRTRNGYIYFVQVNLASGKKIKLPTFEQGASLTYQILKKWHEKALFREKTILHDA
jgi:hypothetical protein